MVGRSIGMYDKILITLDTTPTDRVIVDHIRPLAKMMKSRITLLHVADGWAARIHGPDAVSPEVEQDQAYLDKIRGELSAEGFEVQSHLAFGDPVTEIVPPGDRKRLRSDCHEHSRTSIDRRSVAGCHRKPRSAPRKRTGLIAEGAGMKETITINFDGGSRGNPGPAGIGVVLSAEDGTPLVTLGKYIGSATNNVAEYIALILGLREAAKLGATKIHVRGDSELVIKQMRGEYRVKNPAPQAVVRSGSIPGQPL